MATATLQSESTIRKAAVLVRSLDAESVAALLARLSPAEAKAVRQAVRELDAVSDEERLQIAAELRGQRFSDAPPQTAAPPDSEAGVDVLFSGGYEPPAAASAPTEIMASVTAPAPRLGALSQADPEALLAYLKLEQPSTIAVVLSCLPPDRAADVLSRLPEDLQDRAVNRLSEMGDIDPDSLDVIAAELESWIAQHTQDRRRRDDRRATLQAILDASPATARGRLADQLAARWPELKPAKPPAPKPAERPTPATIELPRRPTAPPKPAPRPALPFTEVEKLSGAELAAVFARVDRGTLLVALFGASDQLLARLREITTTKQMRALEQSINRLGPVRLSDVAHAQRAVGEAAAERVAQPRRAA